MIYKSHAKVNLTLDVLGRDKNGYHFVNTILQKIPLFDEINIEESDENLVVFEGEEAGFIDVKKNTVKRAIELLGPSGRYKIIVKKNIPVGAGLGGGSSNAATVLNAINEIEKLGLLKENLRKIAAEIGMDAPFFIEPGTAVGSNYGEKLEILPDFDLKNFYSILLLPDKRKKTKQMYENLNLNLCGKKKNDTDKLISILKNGLKESVFDFMHNDFETILDMKTPKIKNAHTILCGSGTAFFSISSSPFDLTKLYQELPNLRILDLRQ